MSDPLQRPVRVGMIGTGGRGRGLLGILMALPDIEVPAVCDINPAAAKTAQYIVASMIAALDEWKDFADLETLKKILTDPLDGDGQCLTAH